MKSLLLMLVLGIASTSTYSQVKKKVDLPSGLKGKLEHLAGEVAYNLRKENARSNSGLKKKAVNDQLVDALEVLYSQGYMELSKFRALERMIRRYDNDDIDKKGSRENGSGDWVPYWFAASIQARKVRDWYKEKVRNDWYPYLYQNRAYCKVQGDMATAGKCCEGSDKQDFVGYQNSTRGKSCSDHDDCASKYCVGIDTGEGYCDNERSCYVYGQKDEECTKANPYCQPCEVDEDGKNVDLNCKSLVCLPVDHNSNGMGEFAKEGQACGSNDECATDNCVGGTCAYKAMCTKCLNRGERPGSEEICCPGLYKSMDGVCITTMPPFGLPSNVQKSDCSPKEKSAIDTVLDLISYLNPLSNAYAEPVTVGVDQTMNSFLDESGEGCINYESNGLTPKQQEQYVQCINNAEEIKGEGRQDEFARCDREMNNFLEENRKERGESAQNIGNAQNCSGGGTLDRSDYAELYNTPAITSKTFSNVKQCEFNTFNDSWRSAKNIERNAEITLRAFEAVYSGKGTIDYIVDSDGRSVYERAQSVALRLREYRYEMIKSFQELDQKMSCKCLAIFGPEKDFKFENNEVYVDGNHISKKEYFNQYCGGESNYLGEDGTRGSVDSEDGTNRSGLADETVAQNDETAGQDEFGKKMSEVDKGAVGLSHEKLIVEWLSLRRQVQKDRFQDNSEME